jgi:hypothetical protein
VSLLGKKPRWVVLAVGLVISVGIGSALGRAYEASLGPAPEAVDEAAPGDDSEALLAEALDLERPAPPPRPPEASPERRAQLARNLVQVERTGQVALRARMPLPPKAGALISIGDQLDAHGVPMNLAAFETQMSVVDVLDFYARHFESQGWPYSTVPSAKAAVPHPRLSATLLEEELQLTVMVMPHGEGGGSTVILGQADMEAFRKGAAREDTGDLPVYPGTRPVAVRARDEGRATLTVSFDTGDTPTAVEDFYRKALAQRGYTEVADARQQEGDTAAPRTLHFASRGGAWNLALSAQGKGTAVTAHSTRHLEAAP